MQFHNAREQVLKSWILIAGLCLSIGYALIMFGFSHTSIPAQMIKNVSWLPNQDANFDQQQIRALNSANWQDFDVMQSYGMQTQVHWLKVRIPPKKNAYDARLFEIANPLIDNIDIWFYESEAAVRPIEHLSTGDRYALDTRKYQYDTFVVDFSELSTSPTFAMIKIQTSGNFKVPIRLWQPDDFLQHTAHKRLKIGGFFGFLVAIALSNLFFFLTSKNLAFFFYSAHVLCFTLLSVTLLGYGQLYLWPQHVWVQNHAIIFFASLSLVFALFFTNKLLALDQYNKKVLRSVQIIIGLFIFNLLLSLLLPFKYSIFVFFTLLLVALILVSAICIWLSIKRVAMARYYSLAWTMILICSLAVGMDSMGFVALHDGINIALLYGGTGETLLLAFVLALSYSSQSESLAISQAMAVQAEQQSAEAKDKLLALEQQSKDELEYKVQERTLELEITLRELSEANAELERLNTVDPLTGIRNRRHFDKRLTAEGRRSRREQSSLCLVMLDIDHFKRINDSKGHDIGDLCLQHVASLAKRFIKRPSDDLCRYGGEEFALILPNTTEEGAMMLVNEIRQTIASTPCATLEGEVEMTLSAGVASGIVEQLQGEKSILKNADKALYQAKQQGRNRVCAASQLGEQ